MPLHPAIVHLPLGLAMVIPFLAIGIWWSMRIKRLPQNAWVIVFALQLILTTSTFVAVETGEDQEHQIKDLGQQEILHEAMEAHEREAELFFRLSVMCLGLCLLGLWNNPKFKTPSQITACLCLFLLSYLAFRAGSTGGLLVYDYQIYNVIEAAPEIQP